MNRRYIAYSSEYKNDPHSAQVLATGDDLDEVSGIVDVQNYVVVLERYDSKGKKTSETMMAEVFNGEMTPVDDLGDDDEMPSFIVEE